MKTLARAAAALALGFAGGLIFRALGLPLPWMLGSLAAGSLAALVLKQDLMPPALRTAARPVVGVLAGAGFTPDIVASLGDAWILILVVAGSSIAVTFLGWVFFRFCGFDRITAFFAAAPGGLAELTLIGASVGGSMRSLVLVHATRVIMVVTLIPLAFGIFLPGGLSPTPLAGRAAPDVADWAILIGCGLAGFGIARGLGLRSGLILPALVLSAFAHALGVTAAAPPQWIVALVQIVIGAAAGGSFSKAGEQSLLKVTGPAIVWTLILLLIATLLAAAAAHVSGRPLAAFICAFAPGGLAEMTILAYAAGTEVALVVFCQVIRVFTIQLAAPGLFRLLRGPGLADPRD